MSMTPDALVALCVATLRGDADRPLPSDSVLDHDLLPVDEDELPVVGVYLADDRPLDESSSTGSQQRQAMVRVEIRAVGAMLPATQPFRAWAARTLLALGGPDFDISLGEVQPFGIASNQRLAGADMDFLVSYIWRPE